MDIDAIDAVSVARGGRGTNAAGVAAAMLQAGKNRTFSMYEYTRVTNGHTLAHIEHLF